MPTLLVFRSVRAVLGAGEGAVLPGVFGRSDSRGGPFDRGVGRPEDTLRWLVAGVDSREAPDAGRGPEGVAGELREPFLTLDIGNAGRGVFGGP